MSWTKRQLILRAFGVDGLASYAPNLTPTQLQDALDSLDSQMNEWYDKGIVLLYPYTDDPSTSDLDDDSNLVRGEITATYLNLAILLAPEFGKTLSNDTQKRARSAFTTLLGQANPPPQKALPTTMPKGQGTRYWRWNDPFIDPEVV